MSDSSLDTNVDQLRSYFEQLYNALTAHLPEEERPAALTALTESWDLARALARSEVATLQAQINAVAEGLQAVHEQRDLILGELHFLQKEHRELLRAVQNGDIADPRIQALAMEILGHDSDYATTMYREAREEMEGRVADSFARALGVNYDVAQRLTDVLLGEDAYLPEGLSGELADVLDRIGKTLRGQYGK